MNISYFLFKNRVSSHTIQRQRRKKQKVKERDECNLFILAQEAVLAFSQENLESSHSQIFKVQILKLDRLHQELT